MVRRMQQPKTRNAFTYYYLIRDHGKRKTGQVAATGLTFLGMRNTRASDGGSTAEGIKLVSKNAFKSLELSTTKKS